MSDENAELDEQKKMQKNVVYYQTFLNAWVEHSIEVNKQLLTLSTAAIGFLVFMYDKLNDDIEKILWLSTGGLFILTIILVLIIFYINPIYIRCVIDENNEDKSKKKRRKKILSLLIRVLEFITFIIFVSAVSLIFITVFFQSNLIW